MKKSGLLVILLAVVVIAVIVILFLIWPRGFSDKDIFKNPVKAMEFCKNSPLGKTDDCYSKIAQILSVNNTEISIQACLAISDDGFKKQCIEDLANQEQNITQVLTICNKIINDNGFKQHCYGRIENSGDLNADTQIAMCDTRMGSEKDNCYRGVADRLWETEPAKGLEVCKKISDSNTKGNCLNNFMGSPELIKANPAIAEEVCSLSPLSMKSNCYNNFAQTLSGTDPKQGVLICQKLSDDVQISNCYGNAWFSFDSVILQNYDFAIGLCNVLTLRKDDCLRRTADVFMNSDKTKAEAICRLMSASVSAGCLNNLRR